jgi:ankyrin repeat protein
VVHLLLRQFEASRLTWQDPAQYGDSWTPLMAAAVANRTDVALCLLTAAGSGAPALVAAANRYGQTAVHVAARKADRELLKLLLAHGGAATVRCADACGATPVDVARSNANAVAMREFAACMMGA